MGKGRGPAWELLLRMLAAIALFPCGPLDIPRMASYGLWAMGYGLWAMGSRKGQGASKRGQAAGYRNRRRAFPTPKFIQGATVPSSCRVSEAE